MTIGLKGSWKERKDNGCYLRHRIKELRWDIKYAFQRAWRGYDSRDIFNMNSMFIEKYKVILKRYRDKHNCLFNVPDEYKDMFNKMHFNEEETNAIIDTMIFHLEMLDEDYVEKKLFGKNIYDDDYDFEKDFSLDKAMYVWKIVDQNKCLFMKLFNIFFWELWY